MLKKIASAIRDAISGKKIIEVYENGNRISIVEKGDERVLKFNEITYSKIRKKDVLTGGYWDYFLPLPMLYENPKVLVVGLGGGTIPFQFLSFYGNISIEIVEVSRKMIDISNLFVPGNMLSNAKIVEGDGAAYVREKEMAYDIIILDAYQNDSIPDAFLQNSFIVDAFHALRNRGVFAVNFAQTLSNSMKFFDFVNKLELHFSVYRMAPMFSGNMLLICGKGIDKYEIRDILSAKGIDKFGINIKNAYMDLK